MLMKVGANRYQQAVPSCEPRVVCLRRRILITTMRLDRTKARICELLDIRFKCRSLKIE